MRASGTVELLVVLLALAITLPAAPASAAFAPVDRPGPQLRVSAKKARAALDCGGPKLAAAKGAPVLLLHGTGSNSKHNWSWTYEPALEDRGRSWCALDSPQNGEGDIQIAGEYVVRAIRFMHRRAGRRIAIIGHSQGGMIPRWPLRFWPGTRPMVDDVIGFAPSNHGTTQARAACRGACTPASWQQRDDSQFMRALNSRQETFHGISYTSVYTRTDVIVVPNFDDSGSSSLHGGGGAITNVATQDICPTDTYEHLAIGTIDPVAYALAIDALEHRGPADPRRIDRRVCARPFMPAVTAPDVATKGLEALVALQTASFPEVAREPELACYTRAGCRPRRR